MSVDITFTLSDKDLDHFQEIIDRARKTASNSLPAGAIEAATREMIAAASQQRMPDFIAARISGLSALVEMLEDQDWQLGESDAERIRRALVYFCETDDLIPDHVPGIGLLDDALYIQLILDELQGEIVTYEEFCAYRTEEEIRRQQAGDETDVSREDWLAAKRESLHKQLKERRAKRRGSWRLRW